MLQPTIREKHVRDFERGSWGTFPDRANGSEIGIAIFHKDISEKGKKLAASYLDCAGKFYQIFVATGSLEADADGLIRTPGINLGHTIDHPELGRGKQVVWLMTDGFKDERALITSTQSYFVSDIDSSLHRPTAEEFCPAGLPFKGSLCFLDADYDWVDRRYPDSAQAEGEYLTALLSLSEVIDNANKTQHMLWEAIIDPELNPSLAQLVRAGQPTQTSGAL